MASVLPSMGRTDRRTSTLQYSGLWTIEARFLVVRRYSSQVDSVERA
jgi:hypothetical protein